MKRSFTIFVLFLLIGAELKAQKQVLFKISVLPNTNYSSVTKMDMNMEMTMVGDSAFTNMVGKKGLKFPMVMQMQTGFNSSVKTGIANLQKEIPFTMNIQTLPSKMTMNGTDTNIPVPTTSQTYYGVYTDGIKAKIDSVAGKKMDENLKASIIKMIEGITGNIKFPEKPMKVGDTFTQDVPMDMPMGTFAAKIICKTTYKLISIENNKAFFDLNYVITMDMTVQKMTIDLSGDGDGKLVYNMDFSYMDSMTNNMNMIFSMVMPQLAKVTMNGKAKVSTNLQTTISKN
jgi:hypothetical protein